MPMTEDDNAAVVKHFGARNVRNLSRNGIKFTGLNRAVPDSIPVRHVDDVASYQIDDNAVARTWNYDEVNEAIENILST